jgi:ring-1,2-phenylacetyl-CoA epoxidase subunit PaaD
MVTLAGRIAGPGRILGPLGLTGETPRAENGAPNDGTAAAASTVASEDDGLGAGAVDPATPFEETALELARRLVHEVVDPEMPYLTLADLGVVRGVWQADDGSFVVELTPTYSACPALAEMKYAIVERLRSAGLPTPTIRTLLEPAWTTDWISAAGREKLALAGVAPPRLLAVDSSADTANVAFIPRSCRPATVKHLGVACPRCGSGDTRLLAPFSGTACKSLYRCAGCLEPFEAVKTI